MTKLTANELTAAKILAASPELDTMHFLPKITAIKLIRNEPEKFNVFSDHPADGKPFISLKVAKDIIDSLVYALVGYDTDTVSGAEFRRLCIESVEADKKGDGVTFSINATVTVDQDLARRLATILIDARAGFTVS